MARTKDRYLSAIEKHRDRILEIHWLHEAPGSTVGGDKGYDTADFAGCRERRCTPHVAQNNTKRRSAIDARTTRHPGYAVSQQKRKQIEEPFGWIKTIGTLRKTRHRGPLRSGGSSRSRPPPTISFASRGPGCDGMSLSGASKMAQEYVEKYPDQGHPSSFRFLPTRQPSTNPRSNSSFSATC